mgnify:CR=1 FL=1
MLCAKKSFVLVTVAGTDLVYCNKSKKPVCGYEESYNSINETYAKISHGDRDKTMRESNLHYLQLPWFAVEIFVDVKRLDFIVRLNVARNAVLVKTTSMRSDFACLLDHVVLKSNNKKLCYFL